MDKQHRSDKGQSHQCTKLLKIPRMYKPGFLVGFDQRTRIFSHLHSTYTEILDDLGGEKSCSKIKTSLVEKYTWLTFMMQFIESRMALKIAEGKYPVKLFNKWLYSVRHLNSLAHRLGLERHRKMVSSSLSSYIGKRKAKNA